MMTLKKVNSMRIKKKNLAARVAHLNVQQTLMPDSGTDPFQEDLETEYEEDEQDGISEIQDINERCDKFVIIN